MREYTFPVVMRGYDRQLVDKYVADVAELVAELEASQLPESVARKALEEVGDQTSGILQQARETAAEIEAQAWSKAGAAIARAEGEAEITRREADRYAEQLADDTRTLWEERQRLIEEMRQLADEVLGVADDALDRVQAPGTDLVQADFTTGSAAGEAGGFGQDDDTASGFGEEEDAAGGFGEEDDTADHDGFGPDDTTAADSGLFAEESRPGFEEPFADDEESFFATDSRPGPQESLSEEEEAALADAGRAGSGEPLSGEEEAPLDDETPAQNENGSSDEATDVTVAFERPPAERRQD